MDIKNIDSSNFIDFVFKNPSKSKNSINLEFQTNNLKELFEDLLDIFTKGMIIKYGTNNKVDLSKLNTNNIQNFNEYFNSFGINLNIIIEKYDLYNSNKYNSNKYNLMKYTNIDINNNTKLEHLKLPFLSNNIVYIISFNFL